MTVATRKIIALSAAALLACIALSGCASTYTAESCPAVNWKQLGYDAGVNGTPLSSVPKAEAKCAEYGIMMDEPIYTVGWEAGRAQYCTPLSILNRSVRTSAPTQICADPYGELAELSAIGDTHRVHAARFKEAEYALDSARSTIRSARSSIRKRDREIVDLKAQLKTANEAQRPEIEHAIVKFEDKIAKNRRRIRQARKAINRAEHALHLAAPLYDDSTIAVTRIRADLERASILSASYEP